MHCSTHTSAVTLITERFRSWGASVGGRAGLNYLPLTMVAMFGLICLMTHRFQVAMMNALRNHSEANFIPWRAAESSLPFRTPCLRRDWGV